MRPTKVWSWTATCTIASLCWIAGVASGQTSDVRLDPLINDCDGLVRALQDRLRSDAVPFVAVTRADRLGYPGFLAAERGNADTLLACLVRDTLDDRPAIRLIVIDPSSMLRVHDAMLLQQQDVGFVAQLLSTELQRAQRKATERAERIVIVANASNASVDRLDPAESRLLQSRLIASSLAAPGVFVAETEWLDRFVPAEQGIPSDILTGWRSRGALLWLLPDFEEAAPERNATPTTALKLSLVSERTPDAPLAVRRSAGELGPLTELMRWSVGATRELFQAEPPTASTQPVTKPTSTQSTKPRLRAADPLTRLARRADAERDWRLDALFRELILSITPGDQEYQRDVIAAYIRFLKNERDLWVRDKDRSSAGPALQQEFTARVIHATFRKLNLAEAQLPQDPGAFMNWPEFNELGDAFSYDDGLQVTGEEQHNPELARMKQDAKRRAWLQLSELSWWRWREGREDHLRLMREALAGHWDGRLTLLAEYFERHRTDEQLARYVYVYAVESNSLQTLAGPAGKAYLDALIALNRPAFTSAALQTQAFVEKELAEEANKPSIWKTPAPTATDRDVSPDFSYRLTPVKRSSKSLAIGEDTVSVIGRQLTIRHGPDLLATFQPGPNLNDKFDRLSYDGRYLWAPIARLSRETNEPSLFVYDTKTRRSRYLSKADGLPTMNVAKPDLDWSPCALAPIGPGKMILVGTSHRTWIAKLSLDEQLAVRIEILHTMSKVEDRKEKDGWRDTTLAFEPERAIPLCAPGKREPTAVLITRRHTAFGNPLLLDLNDHSLRAIDGGRLGASADDLFVIDGVLYNLLDRRRLTADGPYTIRVRRFDLATASFVDIGQPFETDDGESHLMIKLNNQICLLGAKCWIAPRPEGPYKRLKPREQDTASFTFQPQIYGQDGDALIIRMENDRMHRFELLTIGPTATRPSTPTTTTPTTNPWTR